MFLLDRQVGVGLLLIRREPTYISQDDIGKSHHRSKYKSKDQVDEFARLARLAAQRGWLGNRNI